MDTNKEIELSNIDKEINDISLYLSRIEKYQSNDTISNIPTRCLSWICFYESERSNQHQLIIELLKRGANPNFLNSNDCIEPILVTACRFLKINSIKTLLSNTIIKVNPDIHHTYGPPPLHAVCSTKYRYHTDEGLIIIQNIVCEIALELLNYGADPNVIVHDIHSPLLEACINGNLKLVQILLENKANPNLLAPLHVACRRACYRNGILDYMKLLFDHDADPNIEWIINNKKITALSIANELKNQEVITYLTLHGAI